MEGVAAEVEILLTGVSEAQRESISIREIKRFIKETIIRHIGSSLNEGTRYFEAFREALTPADADANLSMAAYEGHPEAIGEIIIRKMERRNNDERRQIVSRFVRRYETTGNTQIAKEWLLKVFEQWGYDLVRNETLLYQIQSEEDHELLRYFSSLPNNHQHAQGVRNYFYNLGVHIKEKKYPDFKKAIPYLIKSIELGNENAASALYKLGQKIQKKEGHTSEDAIKCYQISSENGYREYKNIPTYTDSEKISNHSYLEGTLKATLQLNHTDMSEKKMGIQQLLGSTGGIYWGYIECLWEPKLNHGTSKDLTALKEKMNRARTPEDKLKILEFHLQLAQSITDILIRFEENGEPYRKITKRLYRVGNIKQLFNHLILLGDMSTINQILNTGEEKFRNKAIELIGWHKTWLKNRDLGRHLLTHYGLNQPNLTEKDNWQSIPRIPVGTPSYLKHIVGAALQLNDMSEEAQQKGIYPMLGSTGGPSWGYIECLWQPTTRGEGTHENLTALNERIDQLKTRDDKLEALQFHLQLVESIADILMNLGEAPKTKISNSPYRIKNLQKLYRHLIELGNDDMSTNQILNVGDEEFRNKAARLIESHRRWLGINNLKLSRLQTLYNLEIALPAITEDEV